MIVNGWAKKRYVTGFLNWSVAVNFLDVPFLDVPAIPANYPRVAVYRQAVCLSIRHLTHFAGLAALARAVAIFCFSICAFRKSPYYRKRGIVRPLDDTSCWSAGSARMEICNARLPAAFCRMPVANARMQLANARRKRANHHAGPRFTRGKNSMPALPPRYPARRG